MRLDIGFLKIKRRCIKRALSENSGDVRGNAGMIAVDTKGGCEGKERFETKGMADSVVNRKKGKRHCARQVYSCRACGGWHVGSSLIRRPG